MTTPKPLSQAYAEAMEFNETAFDAWIERNEFPEKNLIKSGGRKQCSKSQPLTLAVCKVIGAAEAEMNAMYSGHDSEQAHTLHALEAALAALRDAVERGSK